MNIINNEEITYFSESSKNINRAYPKFNDTETICLNDSVGRKLAEDVYSKLDYPETEQAACDGYMMNIHADITSLDQFRQIDVEGLKTVGRLISGEDPYILKSENEYASPISAFRKVGSIANTVIPTDEYLQWSLAPTLRKNKPQGAQNIKQGSGLIQIGAHYKKEQLVLKKYDIISKSKKALLKQAGVTQVTVYKNIKIVILYLGYELEYLNFNLELEYIKDCMDSWGYEYEVIKLKPYHSTKIEYPSSIATDFIEFQKEKDRIIKEYDYIIACGLTMQSDFANSGFNKILGSFRKLNEPVGSLLSRDGYSGPPSYYHLTSRHGSPKVETVKVFADNGRQIGIKSLQHDKETIISYVLGYILEVIINMNLYVKSSISQRLYGQPSIPEWKIGQLTKDFDLLQDTKVLWGQYHFFNDDQLTSKVGGFDQNLPTKAKLYNMPQISILNIKDPNPDQISFMQDCNCFIPIWRTSKKESLNLKAGDYIYYLEI